MILNTLYKTDTIIDGIKYNLPSQTINNGYIIQLIWKNENDKNHNDNGPAFIQYYSNGNIQYKEWCINNERHNENGPAFIAYYENGNIQYKEWCINGKLHNENGPAVIRYYSNGNIGKQEYWKNGRKIK